MFNESCVLLLYMPDFTVKRRVIEHSFVSGLKQPSSKALRKPVIKTTIIESSA